MEQAGQWPDCEGGLLSRAGSSTVEIRSLEEPSLTVGLLPQHYRFRNVD